MGPSTCRYGSKVSRNLGGFFRNNTTKFGGIQNETWAEANPRRHPSGVNRSVVVGTTLLTPPDGDDTPTRRHRLPGPIEAQQLWPRLNVNAAAERGAADALL